MSRDYTAEVAELEAAYRANRVANASIATEVRSKYRAVIADEIRRRKQEADIQFAHHLARVKARTGIPLNVIQDEVLHTRSWDRWTYWRDLAGIEPERVSVSAAKAAREAEESPFQWSEDRTVLTVVRNSTGADLDEPVVYDMTTNRWVASAGVWWPDSGTPEENGISAAERAVSGADPGFHKFVSAEIQRAVEAGEVEA